MPFNKLWKKLQGEGWTWDYGSGLISQWYIIPGVVKKESRERGVNTFDYEDDVRRKAVELHEAIPPEESDDEEEEVVEEVVAESDVSMELEEGQGEEGQGGNKTVDSQTLELTIEMESRKREYVDISVSSGVGSITESTSMISVPRTSP